MRVAGVSVLLASYAVMSTGIALAQKSDAAADKNAAPAEKVKSTEKGKSALKSEKEKISYILGHQNGSNMRRMAVEIDVKTYMTAFEESLQGKKSAISAEEAQKLMVALQSQLETKMAAKNKEAGEKNSKEGKAFLDENAKKPGVVKLPSGLQYKVIKEGTGPQPKDSDTVTTHYKGTLINGTVFDSSIDRGEPVSFPVGGVIKGWTEALKLMKVGSKWQLFIPSELAYGAQGAGADIGSNSTLIFEVELLGIGTPTPNK